METIPTESPTPQQEPEERQAEVIPPSPETRHDPSPTTEQPLSQETRESARQIATPLPGGLERVPTPAAPVVGEVPEELLAAVIDDLKQQRPGTVEEVEVVRAESVIWNDGSLGCPQPGMMYTQALVPGYWIVLKIDGETFDYRASERGTFLLCRNPSPVAPMPQPPKD
jgi:hypothetical protein